MAAAAELPLDQLELLDPEIFLRSGYPHDAWRRLRHESPIHYFASHHQPFWAITKHEDITTISKQPELFLNGPRLFLHPRVEEAQNEFDAIGGFERPKTLIEMDNPLHRANRKLISSRFTPAALKKIHSEVDRIARKFVDDMLVEEEGEVD
ncbi:MAG: hypothetical protein KC616_26235, partial [Myxococcales bacterium]|nr:hypothetical protein [Myxococcales bacterium]